MITYKAYGSMGFTCQLPRIIDGFATLGAELHPPVSDMSSPDFTYANDSGGYADAIATKKARPSTKLILNVLDICEPCMPNVDLPKLYAQLREADIVTTISPYVQSQLHRYFGLSSFVIWNPIKSVNSTKRLAGEKPYPQFKAAMIGRLNDPGKRAGLGIQALIHAGYNESEVAMIGNEYPNWGARQGIVSNDVLNDILNSVDFVLMPSAFEGLGLPALEGMVCGAIPIICHDLTTFHDIGYPQHWGCYPSVFSLTSRLRSFQNNSAYLEAERTMALQIGNKIAETLSGQAVASNIIEIYKKLISKT